MDFGKHMKAADYVDHSFYFHKAWQKLNSWKHSWFELGAKIWNIRYVYDCTLTIMIHYVQKCFTCRTEHWRTSLASMIYRRTGCIQLLMGVLPHFWPGLWVGVIIYWYHLIIQSWGNNNINIIKTVRGPPEHTEWKLCGVKQWWLLLGRSLWLDDN